MLKVSIVVSNFNYAAFVNSSVESALTQTYPCCEVIVVDDGSTDNSLEMLEAYSNRVKIFSQPHQGETASRNFGFAHSSGQLVCFLDADDFLAPDAIARVVAAWRPSFTKLQYRLRVVDQAGVDQNLLMPRCRLDSGDVSQRLLKTGRYITSPGSGNVYARSFLEKLVPVSTTEWPQSFDSYAATYAGFFGEIGAIQEALAFYRVHDQNMTRAVKNGKEQTLEPSQIDRLLERQLRLRRLILHIAAQRGLTASPGIVLNHWLYLKLELAKSLGQPDGLRLKLWSILSRMVVSALTASELNIARRFQLIAWSFGSAFLPASLSNQIIKMGFDLAPGSRISRAMRRL